MIRKTLLYCLLIFSSLQLFATGEPSTYFQVFVPPNNDPVRRDAALIITAIYDNTTFEIIDDGMDGDTDDSKTGTLMAGQSYVLYIRDNGINDDARYASGGVLKWDGDYFIVRSSKLVFCSQSTNSDWQHDWVPSTDKKSIGEKFIIYSPPYSSSKRDVNVLAYEPNTTVTFQKISTQPKTNTGFTDVNFESPVTLFQRTINPGEDLIHKYTDGRDAMEAGETYVVLADKPVTVQYGALYGNARDGGGYIPSSNGSSSGALFYFTVPFQSSYEQEIRVVSWDNDNAVQLDRYENGNWVPVKSFALNEMKAADWVGRSDGNVTYATCFRVTCTDGKRVSVFEGNWFETGSPGTSDMATMVTAENGTTSGTRFLTYMAPPGTENNVINPFTQKAFGQQLTHLYIFAKEGATVTIKDAYSNGAELHKTYTINKERYVDVFLTVEEWKSIYNGTGSNTGPERPYLLVESDRAVSVMNTNFNDNWMCYVGTSLGQSFTQSSALSASKAAPADTVKVTSVIKTGSVVHQPIVEVVVQDGLKVVESTLSHDNQKVKGAIHESKDKTVVSFDDLDDLQQESEYTVETQVVASVGNNDGSLMTAATNTSVETIVTGTIDGQVQQSASAEVVNVDPSNTSKLLFSAYTGDFVTSDLTDSWTVSWADINNDGYDDLFMADRRGYMANLVYMNNKAGGFTRGQALGDKAISVTNTWADVDNDGDEDLLVLNNTRNPSTFYKNNNGMLVKDNSPAFVKNVSYYHGGSFADYDNDGLVDLFMCNYFPTRYNELYKNKGNGVFEKEVANVIPAEANQSIGATWADYDGDGFIDLFVPNGSGFKNSLFHNEGNGTFSKVQNAITAEGGQSVGSCWGDIDNDGDLDLFVTNSNPKANFLYRNDGAGVFTKITNTVESTDIGTSHGCSFADIDNDGDLDLYVTNNKGAKFLYNNNGAGSFTRNTNELIGFDYGNALGHGWSDFDHDGDLDLVVATHSNQANALFVNNGTGNNWLEFRLTGTISNRSAIGADIVVYHNGTLQMREVNSQSGFGGKSSFVQHVGLGTVAVVDSVIIKWPGGMVQRLTNVEANQLLDIVQPQFTRVSGGVYFDTNNNGVKDAGEAMVARAAVQVAPGNTRLYTNEAGYFTIPLDNGTYRFELLDEKGVAATPHHGVTTTVTDSTLADSVWIPAVSTCSNTDMNLVMGGTAIRKGFADNRFTIIMTNNGRTTATGFSMQFKAPATLSMSNPSVPYTSMETAGDYMIYTWDIQRLDAFENKVISFQHSIASTVAIGDSVPVTGWISGLPGDCTMEDNAVYQSYKVVGAIDPNDLQVVPAGYGEEGYIQATQELTYIVRFQNVGNHPATSVTITDELPQGLDMSTFQLVSTSHEGVRMEVQDQRVTFHFEEIYLPDSVSNPEKSQGQVVFKIKPREGIVAGTMLKNQAAIRFDHYAPIVTNEVINTIQSRQQELQLLVVKTWPNPAADVVYVSLVHKMGKFTNRKIKTLELLDMSGRRALVKQFNSTDELRVNIPVLLKGFCFVRVTDSEGGQYLQKILLIKNR